MVLNSRYSLILATSKRARQLIAAGKTQMNGEEKKPLSIAVEELRTGGFKILSEESENYENYEDEPLA